MRVPTVIRVTVGAGGDVHGLEVSEERTQLFNSWHDITSLVPRIIICYPGVREVQQTLERNSKGASATGSEHGEACGR